MKSGTLIIAPPGAIKKKETLFKDMYALCPGNDYSSLLYLGPNTAYLSAARQQFFAYIKETHGKSLIVPFQSYTITQLALNLYETYGEHNIISDKIRTLLLCEILKDGNMGYARLLSDLMRKIRHYILDRDLSQVKEEMAQHIFEEKTLGRAVKAMETLEAYEDVLKIKKLVGPDTVLHESISLIKEHVHSGAVVIDGFFDPTPLEREIMKALLDNTVNALIVAGEHTDFLTYFQSLKGMESKKLNYRASGERAGYYAYPSMEDEGEGIAKGVKKLILEGTEPGEITVSFPVLAKYLPMLRRVFRKYGIPVSAAEYNVSSSIPVVALQELTACLGEDYPRNNFLSVLTSPFFPAIPDTVRNHAVSFAYRAGIVKGRESWLAIQEIIFASSRDDLSEREREKIGEFQKEIKRIISVIDELKQKKDLCSLIDAFEHALNKFGYFDSLEAAGTHDDALSTTINRQFLELRHFAGLYGKDIHNVSPVHYLSFMFQDLKGADRAGKGVRVLPFELAAGLETKALFFGGMIEGDFPSRPGIDPILPERVKQGLGMPHLEYYLERQKRYYKRLLSAPDHDPYISCPSADGDKVFLPSPFLDWERAMVPPSWDIYSSEEVLIREGAVRKADSSGISWGGRMRLSAKTIGDLHSRGRLSGGYVSVTDIDFYRKCPLRFYIEKILAIEANMPPRYEVEARLWGSIAHRVMEYLFKEGDIDLDTFGQKLLLSVEKSLGEFPIGDFWSKVAQEIFRRLLPMLIKQETELRMQGYSPYMVEKGIRAEVGGLKLKGKIDRVDRHRTTNDESRMTNDELRFTDIGKRTTENTVILMDYKTGTIDTDSLQMPLYAGMWQKNFTEAVKKVGYYSLKEGAVKQFPKKGGMENFIQDAMQKAGELVRCMQQGKFPADPFKAQECRYCYHRPLCNSSK